MYSPTDFTYEQLEEQWGPLLERFCKRVDTSESREDILQELRIVLMRAQQKYDSSRGVKFVTYLWSACSNRIGNLYRARNKASRIPQELIEPLSRGVYFNGDEECWIERTQPAAYDDHTAVEALYGAPWEAQAIAQLVLGGVETKRGWRESGLTNEQIEKGISDLSSVLKGDSDV
ncbi:hypothetical protein LCGC14_2582930 [marine sediment metagenome]|uniref:RNA polymerase sigma-70 region 2 domain-containing protein n=1 Tax=marine sediment metagenome TaxID=412755 RepID=A0A0F9CQ14_9ZZZZ